MNTMLSSFLIKVCGLRDCENIRAVAALGIDLTGFVFWPGSPRCVREGSDLPDSDSCQSPRRVGVFVDEKPSVICQKIRQYRLDFIQMHGHERPEDIERLRYGLDNAGLKDVGLIKALGITSRQDLAAARDFEGLVSLLLFDTRCQERGGSGQKFDWSVLESYGGDTPFLLSGGIAPDDAQRIGSLRHPRLAGIDLNSRFELAPGLKDVGKLRLFLSQLRLLIPNNQTTKQTSTL